MAEKQDKVEIMALWENVNDNGFRYLTGHLNGARVVAFWNTEKRNEKEPDLRIYVQNKPKDAKEDEPPY